MNHRLLPREEYNRLKEVWPFSVGSPIPDPNFSRVMVAEDNGQIVGYWFAVEVVHVEPVWIHPNYRNGGPTATVLFKGLVDELKSHNLNKMYVFAENEKTEEYLNRLGFCSIPNMRVYYGEV